MTQIMPPGIVGVAILKNFHFFTERVKEEFKMKKIFFLLVLILAMLAIVVPINAQTISEHGLGIFISVGSEKNPIEGTLVLTDDSDQILTPNQGVIEVEQGKSILGQVFINGAKDQNKFEVKWSTMALVSKESLRPTEFHPAYGWTFRINPEDYTQDWGSRPLNIWVRSMGGKKDFIRAIFKITYNKSSLFTTSQLVMKSVPCKIKAQTTESNAGVSKETIEALIRNQQKTADYVNVLANTVNKHDRWIDDASKAKTQKPTPVIPNANINYKSKSDVEFTICFTGSYPLPLKFWVKDSAGNIVGDFCSYGSKATICLPLCEEDHIVFSLDEQVSDGNRFHVRKGMEPFTVEYRPEGGK